MKTERNNRPSEHPLAHQAGETRSRQHSDERSRKVRPGRLDIPSRAREASRMMEEVQKVPDVREDRVLKLRAAIESGTYEVKGSDVAEKLIKESMLGSIL